jgi:hypothetical protein
MIINTDLTSAIFKTLTSVSVSSTSSVSVRTEVESVLKTTIDAQKNSSFSGVIQCKQKVKNTKTPNVKPYLCPHPQAFYYLYIVNHTMH